MMRTTYLNDLDTLEAIITVATACAANGENVSNEMQEIDRRIQEALEKIRPEQDESRLYGLIEQAASIRHFTPIKRLDADLIRLTFANAMATLTLTQDNLKTNFSAERGQTQLTACTILNVIDQSHHFQNAISLVQGSLTEENCPLEYRELFDVIIALKRNLAHIEQEHMPTIQRLILHPEERNPLQATANKILQIAEQICQRPLFQSLMTNVEDACNVGVTEELIADTFYHLMLEQTEPFGLIPKGAISERDSYIYTALPTHTIIEALVRSKGLKQNVWLLGSKVVTSENCPPKYQEFAATLFHLKDAIDALTPDQIKMIKLSYINEDGMVIPEDLLKLQTPKLMVLAGTINDVAIKISQLDTFKAIIEKVLVYHEEIAP